MPQQFVKFLLVGAVNSIFGFAVYILFALSELSNLMVLIWSSSTAIIFNFYTMGSFVFSDIGVARMPRFIILYATVLIINLKLIEWLSPISGGRIHAMAIIILPMACLIYLMQRCFVFRK
jgi:putative flippase GtrA